MWYLSPRPKPGQSIQELRDQLQRTLTGTHTLERELGGGGMSRVFVAEETRLKRKVVIKVLSPELAQGLSVERFEREIQMAASLQQANIVPVLSAGDTDGFPFFAMPFVEGESLRNRVAQGPLPIADVVSILRDVSRALSYAHGRGIVHRDIKPDNVLLSSGAAVVTDFGIAKAISAARTHSDATTLTQTGTSIGTPAYMAPEQAAGDPDVDSRADIYALGCMGYELLAGQPPFTGQSAQRVIAAQMTETPKPIEQLRPDVPHALGSLVMRCLAKSPSERPQSADELIRTLNGVNISGSNASAVTPRATFYPARLRTWVVGLCLAAAVLFAVYALFTRASGAGPAAVTHSLAVLPIENSGGDSTKEYLADGMTSELAGQLRQTPGISVVGDLSTSRFKHSQLAPSEIAKQLGVAMLLTGKMQSLGNTIRLQMQLLDAGTGKIVWSQKFDREMKENFAVQDEVAAAIAGEMRLALSPANTAVAHAGRTENPEAHDLYMRAVSERNKLSEQGLQRAVEYFEKALTLDPNYARASAGLALAYDMQADAFLPSHPLHLLAKAAAERALQSDSMLAEAHVLYGFELAAATWDFDKGLAEIRRGLALDPNAPDALFMGALFIALAGHTDEALGHADRLIKVDPLSAMGSLARTMTLGFTGRWPEVLRQDSVTKRLDASVVYADAWDGTALREMGRLPESVQAYEAFQRTTGQPAFGLALTYGSMGRRNDAMRIIDSLVKLRKTQWVDPNLIAAAYAGLGDRDHAMQWLERGFAEKTFTLRFLVERDAGWLKGVRDDPRFVEFKKKVMITTFKE